jgi:AcrR family transcriptional regulator
MGAPSRKTWRTKAPHGHGRRAKSSMKQDILDAAEQAIRECADRRITMQDIVDRIGCAKGLPYSYFRNKQELLQGVIDRQLTALRDMVNAAMSDSNGPLESLKCALRAVCCFRDAHESLFQAIQTVPFLSARILRYPEETGSGQPIKLARSIIARLRTAQRERLVRMDVSPETLLVFFDAVAFSRIANHARSTEGRAALLWELMATGLQCRK